MISNGHKKYTNAVIYRVSVWFVCDNAHNAQYTQYIINQIYNKR